MSEATLCKVCKKDLATCETIIAAEGILYCSRMCAAIDNPDVNIDTIAEEVNPTDIGLKEYMKRDQILAAIKDLAKSQGFYSRLYHTLTNANADDYRQFMNKMEAQKFTDTVDMILFLES